MGETLVQVDLPVDDTTTTDVESLIHTHANGIEQAITDAVGHHTAVKFYVTVGMELSRATEIGDQTTTASFRTPAYTDAYYNPMEIIDNISEQLDAFNERGSSWQVSRILNLSVSTGPYHPLAGSAYMPLPTFLSNKHCCINIQN